MAGNEVERIRAQLRNAVAEGGWHGPGLLEVTGALGAADAAARPLSGAHNAWEIALHVLAWLETVAQRLEGNEVEPTPAENWTDVAPVHGDVAPRAAAATPAGFTTDAATAAWSDVQARLSLVHEKLQETLAGMQDRDLLRTVPGRDHDNYFMLHGIIQHTLYHAGQIAILGRGARAPTSAS